MFSMLVVPFLGALALRNPNPDTKVPYWIVAGFVAFLAAGLATVEAHTIGV